MRRLRFDFGAILEKVRPSDTQSNLLAIGANVGEYLIEALVGESALGTVYRAVHPVIGREVAVKVLAEPLANDPLVRAEFEREARVVNDSTHPNLVDVFAFGLLPDRRPYYVMELVAGKTLREWIDEHGTLDPAEALALVADVARALGAMHARGVVHRELSPESVLVIEEGPRLRVKLLDFGVARPPAPDALRSRTGRPRGFPLYLSPEQCMGQACDGRSDLFALGVMLFEALSGTTPNAAATFAELLENQVSGPVPRLSLVMPGVPEAVADFVSTLLAKKPEDRPASAEEVVARIETLVERLPEAARAEPPTTEDPTPLPGPIVPRFESTGAHRLPEAAPSEADEAGERYRPRRPTGEVDVVEGRIPVVAQKRKEGFLQGEGFLAQDQGGPARLVLATIVLVGSVLVAVMQAAR